MKLWVIPILLSLALTSCQVQFVIEEVETFYFLLSVFAREEGHLELTTAYLTVNVDEEPFYSTELEAETNVIELREDQTDFLLILEKPGYEPYEGAYSQEELVRFFDTPLIVVLNER